jgi:hypothetical protein
MDDLEEKLRRLLKEEEEKKKKINWFELGIALSKIGKAMATPEAQNAVKEFNKARHKLRKSQWEFCQKFPDDGLCKKLRERGPLFQPLIYKYGISERDLYVLGVIEEKKSSASSFESLKLEGKAKKVRKAYNIKYGDIRDFREEITIEYQLSEQLFKEKFGIVDLETIKSNWHIFYLLVIIPINICLILYFILLSLGKLN